MPFEPQRSHQGGDYRKARLILAQEHQLVRRRLLFELQELLLGCVLFLGIAAQEAVGGSVGTNAVPTGEVADGAATDADSLVLMQVSRQLRIGPLGAQPTAGHRALHDPLLQRRCQRGCKQGPWSGPPADVETRKTLLAIQPNEAAHGPHRETLGLGNVRLGTASGDISTAWQRARKRLSVDDLKAWTSSFVCWSSRTMVGIEPR